MADALRSMAPPPAPMPQGPLTGGPQQQAPDQQQQQAPPAPTHGQTMAALRHFDALIAEGKMLLKNPDLGKADCRSAIIDGATKLVADRIVPPGQAVAQLATVPDRPFDQKKWVEQQMQSAMAARNAVIDHHVAAFSGAPDAMAGAPSSPDSHMDTMSGMMSAHYAGR